jgi:hypothetical protein
MGKTAGKTRVESLVGAPLAEDAIRQWPQSGEVLRGRARIAEVESHFPDLKLALENSSGAPSTAMVESSGT